jgi:soluble lytic murein transglycosylase
LFGLSSEAQGQLELAARAYRELRILVPASGYADGAGDRLRRLDALGVKLPPLSLAQRVERVERLLRGGVADVATSEAERIVDETREGGGVFLRALRVVADGARTIRRWDLAGRALELMAARAPAEQRPALRLEYARLIARGSQRERALALFDALARSGADAEAAEALWERGRLLEDLDRPADAAEAYRGLAARWPGREVAAAGLWRLGWLAWLAGDVRGAGESWTRLTGPAGGPYRAPGLYWAGRAREQSGGNAARLYQQVLAEAPRTYYGVLATARLGNGARGVTKAALVLPPEPGTALAHDPGWARVDLLRRIGLVEHAWEELEDVVQQAAGDPVKLYGFSGAYVREARYHLALRILRKHFAAPAATGDPALPRAFWEMLYPFGWRGAVEEAAQQAGLDPLLVAAVVREESSYHPRAVSRAGARGLMQLMPGTAKPMAPAGDLDDPALNLRIGARFLAGLLRDFGDPRLALAAYNAGPKRLRQWWSVRRSDDVEAFVEQIPYDETRHYVKRVMLSWDEYRRIWGGSAK